MALYLDITDDVVAELGIAVPSQQGAPQAPASMRWDCNIGGLPFLFGMSQQYPFRRETSEFRRQRIDNERDPGEQSLDSGFWIRSQSSWHYGSGITTAEPVESNSDETRFRYYRSGGVDIWTPGQVSLLNTTTNAVSAAATGLQLIGVNTGVLYANGTALNYVTTGSSTAVTWGGSVNAITSLTTDGTNYYAANSTGVYKGTLPSGAGSLLWNTGGATIIRWTKSRLMATVGNSVYELTGAGPTLPTALFTHPTTGWTWTDIAEGPSAIYLSGYAGDTSEIYKVTVTVSGSTVTLGAPTVVAQMPRGENVLSMYSYVGSFVIVGTTKGARVAAVNSDGSLTVGPLVVKTADGVYDAVADGSYVYVTVGGQGEVGDRTQRAGLYRIDLGQTLGGNPLRFASAPDVVTAANHAGGQARQVTIANGTLWFSTDVAGGLHYRNSNYVTDGWLETGRIRLGTVEPKAWRDIRVIMATYAPGTVTARATVTGVGDPNTWDSIVSVSSTLPDAYGSLNVTAPNPQQSLYVAFNIHATDVAQSPVMIGYQVRAVPAPKRTELIQVPVLLYDYETDRTGARYGKPGGAWKRYQLLKNLETSASTITWKDYITGEQAEAYVERVTWTRTTPPTRGQPTTGGIAQVLLRLV